MWEAEIVVRYPLEGRAITLRTSEDWERDIHPVRVEPSRAVFRCRASQPSLQHKPLLQGAWSRGSNYAVHRGLPYTEVYPVFRPGGGSLTAPFTVRGGDREHRVRCYLPPGYDENTTRRYRVLYVQDGANVFLAAEAFGGREWQIDETLTLLDNMEVIDKVLVVAVYAEERHDDYTAPGYEGYGRFVVDALVPWVDARFRTLPSPVHRAVLGSSLGGVVSLYLGWQYPQVFGKVGALSATFGYRDDLLARVLDEPARPLHVYLDSGWPGDNFSAVRVMADALAARQAVSRLTYYAFPNAAHSELAWAARVHLPFQSFFARPLNASS